MPTVSFAPYAVPQFLDNDGRPIRGGTLETYLAGTSTPAATYADSAGDVANPTTITLDSAGRPANGGALVDLRLDVSRSYKFVLKDKAGATVRTVDNILGGLPAGVVGQQQLADGAVGPTKISNDPADLAQLRDKLRIPFVSVTEPRFGAKGDGVTDDSAALMAAKGSGALYVYLPEGLYACNSLAFDEDDQTWFGPGVLLFNGTNAQRLGLVSGDNVTFDRVVFDGAGKQPHFCLVGVMADTKSPRFPGCVFRNLYGDGWGTTPLNQMYALAVSPYGVTGLNVDGARFENIRKLNDGSKFPALEGIGFVGGIVFMDPDGSTPTAAQSVPTTGSVRSCEFDNIQTVLAAGLSDADRVTFDDGDAIRFYDVANGAGRVDVTVSQCQFKKVSKRAVKISARGPVVEDCDIYAADAPYAMVTPVKVNPDSTVRNIRVHASAAKPVYTAFQWTGIMAPGGNLQTFLEENYVSHCRNGFEFFKDAGASVIENITVSGLTLPRVYDNAIVQTGAAPTTQRNLKFSRINAEAASNHCAGITIFTDASLKSGCTLTDSHLVNMDLKIGGMDATIKGVDIDITTQSWTGRNSTVGLVEIGPGKGHPGFIRVQGLNINAPQLNTAFTSASRQWVVYIAGDNHTIDDLRLTLPEAMPSTHPHMVIEGDDFVLDGFDYFGNGFIHVGRFGAPRGAIYKAARLGRGASSMPFLLLGNIGSTTGCIINVDGVTDFRPTSAPTIQCSGGDTPVAPNTYSFVLQNVRSCTTNASVVTASSIVSAINCAKF